MITKQMNNYVGYGSSEEEALNSCKIISIIKNTSNVDGFEDLRNKHSELSPWSPKKDTLHIRNLGYIKVVGDNIDLNNVKVKITPNMFEMLYKVFYKKLTMVEMIICSREVQNFFSSNNIKVPNMYSYQQVVPTDIYLFDESVKSHVIFDNYDIVFLKEDKVAIKRTTEDYYWTCSYDPNITTIIDTLYYIAYVRGYEDMESIIYEVI